MVEAVLQYIKVFDALLHRHVCFCRLHRSLHLIKCFRDTLSNLKIEKRMNGNEIICESIEKQYHKI